MLFNFKNKGRYMNGPSNMVPAPIWLRGNVKLGNNATIDADIVENTKSTQPTVSRSPEAIQARMKEILL